MVLSLWYMDLACWCNWRFMYVFSVSHCNQHGHLEVWCTWRWRIRSAFSVLFLGQFANSSFWNIKLTILSWYSYWLWISIPPPLFPPPTIKIVFTASPWFVCARKHLQIICSANSMHIFLWILARTLAFLNVFYILNFIWSNA